MVTKKVLTRESFPTEELSWKVEKVFKGVKLFYTEVYYLDYEVDEETGKINRDKKVRHYTKEQMNRNLRALKSAYFVAKGAASPDEIIDFRKRYRIAASTLSIVLGFSKNTISNIENEGVTSLPTGRLIKLSITDKKLLHYYVELCSEIETSKKIEISNKLEESEI